MVAQLKDKGSVTRGWIGVQIQPVTADIADSLGLKNAEGALVAEPQADGPAAKAGIQSGDVIIAVNGEPVKDARDLAKKIGEPGARRERQARRRPQGRGEDRRRSTLGELPREQRQARAQRPTSASSSRHRGAAARPLARARRQGRRRRQRGRGRDRRSIRTARPPSAASGPAT